MKFVNQMTPEELITLSELKRNGPAHRPRERAQILLLSHDSFSISELCKIFGHHRNSISLVIDRWETMGIVGLFDDVRSGRPPIIRKEDLEKITDQIKETPRSLKLVIDEIGKKFNRFLSMSTLKRLAKKLGFTWKRVRKSLKNKRNQEDFDEAKLEIESLLELAKANETSVELYYFDGSCFSLTPNVPYAWQEKGMTIELDTARSKNINVLGFMSATGRSLVSYCFEDSVNSDVIIACFDSFAKTLDPKKQTFVVLDNAPTHKSNDFKAMIERWELQGLYLYFLPPYSPELNKIEILWRFIKYQWLPFSSTASMSSLRENLYEILKDVGGKYQITFE